MSPMGHPRHIELASAISALAPKADVWWQHNMLSRRAISDIGRLLDTSLTIRVDQQSNRARVASIVKKSPTCALLVCLMMRSQVSGTREGATESNTIVRFSGIRASICRRRWAASLIGRSGSSPARSPPSLPARSCPFHPQCRCWSP